MYFVALPSTPWNCHHRKLTSCYFMRTKPSSGRKNDAPPVVRFHTAESRLGAPCR